MTTKEARYQQTTVLLLGRQIFGAICVVKNMAQQYSDFRTWQTTLPKMFSGLVLAATILGAVPSAWGQANGFSRWSSSNPPTPSQVAQPANQADEVPRRLPPVEEEVTAKPSTPSFGNTEEARVAAQPQRRSPSAETAKSVDWSNPAVVIGPETRQVSHEEVIPSAPEPSRNSASTVPSGSRFTQSNVAPVDTESAPEPGSGKSVFARVFDETNEVADPSAEETASDAAIESASEAGVEPKSADEELSPIFACRLLGLRTTKAEKAAKN